MREKRVHDSRDLAKSFSPLKIVKFVQSVVSCLKFIRNELAIAYLRLKDQYIAWAAEDEYVFVDRWDIQLIDSLSKQTSLIKVDE